MSHNNGRATVFVLLLRPMQLVAASLHKDMAGFVTLALMKAPTISHCLWPLQAGQVMMSSKW